MSGYVALIISIGVLAFADTFMAATVLSIPVWVTFIAWTSFFACGGGRNGLIHSVASNWYGIFIAAASVFCIGLFGASSVAAGICVGLGTAAMIVFGFALFVGTTAAMGRSVATHGIDNPIIVAGFSMLAGAPVGFVSEMFANVLTNKLALA